MKSSSAKSHFQLALRVRHPSVDPDEITKQFGWQPTRAYRAGDPRTTPKGNPLAGHNKETFWYAELSVGEGDTISSVINAANQRLVTTRNYIEQFVNDGGVIEYSIGWFVDSNVGETLDWKLLQECAALRAKLIFDIYPPDTNQKT